MSLGCRYSVFIPNKAVLSFDIFYYNKEKKTYAAFDVTMIQKFREIIKDLA